MIVGGPRGPPHLQHLILNSTAVLNYKLGTLEKAKENCATALKRRRKSDGPLTRNSANNSAYLMGFTIDRYLGQTAAAEFYRSLLLKDYSPPGWYNLDVELGKELEKETPTPAEQHPVQTMFSKEERSWLE